MGRCDGPFLASGGAVDIGAFIKPPPASPPPALWGWAAPAPVTVSPTLQTPDPGSQQPREWTCRAERPGECVPRSNSSSAGHSSTCCPCRPLPGTAADSELSGRPSYTVTSSSLPSFPSCFILPLLPPLSPPLPGLFSFHIQEHFNFGRKRCGSYKKLGDMWECGVWEQSSRWRIRPEDSGETATRPPSVSWAWTAAHGVLTGVREGGLARW